MRRCGISRPLRTRSLSLGHTIYIAFSEIYHPFDLYARETLASAAAVRGRREITAKFGDGLAIFRHWYYRSGGRDR